MDKTSTQYEAFLYVYNELNAEENMQFEAEMLFNASLRKEVEELKKLKMALGEVKALPSKRAEKNIYQFSAAYQAVHMPDDSFTDLLLN